MVSAQDSMTKRSSRGLAKFFKRDGGGGGRGERGEGVALQQTEGTHQFSPPEYCILA